MSLNCPELLEHITGLCEVEDGGSSSVLNLDNHRSVTSIPLLTPVLIKVDR